jgi:hypothetical protein
MQVRGLQEKMCRVLTTNTDVAKRTWRIAALWCGTTSPFIPARTAAKAPGFLASSYRTQAAATQTASYALMT